MNPKDQAQKGLEMIQDAILQLIRERGPLQPHDVTDTLELRWECEEGGQSASIGYQIMLAMAATGKLAKDPGVRPTYSLGPNG